MKNVLIRIINKISVRCSYESAVWYRELLVQLSECCVVQGAIGAVIRVLSGTGCFWCSVPSVQNSCCSVEGLFSLCLFTACSTNVFWCSRGMYCLLVQGDWILQMEAVCSSVTLVGTCTAWPVDRRNSLHLKVAFVSPLVWILVAKGAVRLLIG
jgi:predicted Co/Zn/Cd cation transporter (cation efflux family)